MRCPLIYLSNRKVILIALVLLAKTAYSYTDHYCSIDACFFDIAHPSCEQYVTSANERVLTVSIPELALSWL